MKKRGDDGIIKVHALVEVRGKFKFKSVHSKVDNWDDAKFIIEQIDIEGLESC